VVDAAGSGIYGNTVGTDRWGRLDLGNGEAGIHLTSRGSNARIGGLQLADATNIISGNEGPGIDVVGAARPLAVQIQGNLIGMARSVWEANGNASDGVRIDEASRVTVDTNHIAGNGASGVALIGPSADQNLVINNVIGSRVNTPSPFGNAGDGIRIEGGSGNRLGASAETSVR
jgi:Periplasmic copper-binding protein (NosD)